MLSTIPVLFWVTLSGALFSALAHRKNVRRFSLLGAINIPVGKDTSPAIAALDLVITTSLGAIVAYLVTEPSNPQQASIVGFGFTRITTSLNPRAKI